MATNADLVMYILPFVSFNNPYFRFTAVGKKRTKHPAHTTAISSTLVRVGEEKISCINRRSTCGFPNKNNPTPTEAMALTSTAPAAASFASFASGLRCGQHKSTVRSIAVLTSSAEITNAMVKISSASSDRSKVKYL